MNEDPLFDPLEDLMAQAEHAANPSSENINSADTTIVNTNANIPEEEDEYGIHDQQREMDEEEAIMEAARAQHQAELAAAAEAAKENLKDMPPQSLDPAFQKESIEFQSNVLAIVGRMIDRVVSENNLPPGEIPEATDDDPEFKRHLMGELISIYHISGEEITPEFRNMIISNWIPKEGFAEEENADEPAEEQVQEVPIPREITPEININVEPGQPVNVNIDGDVVAEMTTTRKVKINVIETTIEQLRSATVIENSQRDDIITPYDAGGMYNTPITLPLSGYRCEITPLSFIEYIQMTSTPPSASRLDQDKRVWSIIYRHLKNVSIGEFKDFEDFLKKTKYADQQLLQWGVLIAAAEDEETATIICGNPKCQKPHTIKYKPRSIIHINDELAAECDFKTTSTVAPGAAAIEHYNKINSTVKMYELPHTKYRVEIDSQSSAYDFLNVRYPVLESLKKRFPNPNDNGDNSIIDADSDNQEYEWLVAHAMFVKAISIPKTEIVNGVETTKLYRFTNWDDIERILTIGLDAADSGALMNLIQKVGMRNFNPIQFYLENITCDKCGRHDKRIPIPDIAQSLLFHLSQRLSSMEISLTETEQN